MAAIAVQGGLRADINLPHDEPLELYHNALSLCSGKVRVCLAEKGQAFKSKHIHLIETGWYQTCSPEYKKINPNATVPLLVHNGHPVYESTDQIRYIDSTFPGQTLKPPSLAKEVDQWVDMSSLKGLSPEHMAQSMGSCIPGLTFPLFAAMIVEIPYREIAWGLLHHPDKKRPISFILMKLFGPRILNWLPPMVRMREQCKHHMRKHLEGMEKSLADGREFLTGNTLTLADVGMVTIFERMEVAGWQKIWKDLKNVATYWSRLKARPSYQSAICNFELDIIAKGRARIEEWKQARPGLMSEIYGPYL